MKKFFTLLTLFCMFVGAAWAGPTDLPEISTEGSIKWYTIKNTRSGKYANYAGDATKMTQVETPSLSSLFYFTSGETTAEGFTSVMIHNAATTNKFENFGSWTEEGHEWFISIDQQNETPAGLHITRTAAIGAWNGTAGWNACNDGGANVTDYAALDAGSVFVIEKANFETLVANAKASAIAEIETLSSISEIYPDVASYKTSINGAENSIDGLRVIANCINDYNKSIDGKNVKFCNQATDDRGGNYLGYDKANSRAAAVADGGDAAIWTIKTNADGTFKLYNWVNNHYLGTPADPTPVVADEADAPSFKFIVTAENEVAIATGDKMLHIANHSNYKVINYWSTTDKASLWAVSPVSAIVVNHEQYNAALEAAAALPYAIQQAYGLVTDAANYYSNWKSEAEGSYEALLDNTVSTYFHSAYTDEAKAETAETHYIQATFAEGVGEFYFYMLPRSGNGNNRPQNVTVSGSNDGSEFTKICDVTTTLNSSMNPYVSAKLGTNGKTYKYIRLTVNSTNSNSKFFTLSELYFLPANTDVTNLVGAYNNFASSSITSNEMSTAVEALINAESTLSLSNIKKEVQALLTANESKHAEKPKLGQYPTTAYNALNTAYTATDATQESLEAAIAAFHASLNAPVYIFSGVHNYADGKAIYYNGANPEWRWDTKNVYNKAMWFSILGLTTSEFELDTEYNVVDMNGRNIYNKKAIKFCAIENWDGVYNLNFGAAEYDYLHLADHTNNTIASWYPAAIKQDGTPENGASAWKVEYIGNSYDLAQLSEDLQNAAAELAAVNVPNFSFAARMNSYDPNTKHALDAAVTNRAAVLSKFSTAAEIATAKEQLETAIAGVKLNMPVAGNFYRIRCTDGNRRLLSSISDGNNRLKLADTMTGESIYYYTGNALLSYVAGKYINAYNFNEVGETSTVVITPASTGTLGCYNIQVGERMIYGAGETIDSGTGTPDNRAGYRWWLEEVTSLPVTITEAGYATIYAPVALTLPEDLTTYTVSAQSETSATLKEVEGVIPANTGVVLSGEAKTYDLTIAESEATVTGNLLKGSVAAQYINSSAYILANKESKVGFYKAEQTDGQWVNNGFKAYLPATPAGARFLGFDFGTETGIGEVETEGENVVIYDLSGRRVQKAQKGLYIVNGKKVIK